MCGMDSTAGMIPYLKEPGLSRCVWEMPPAKASVRTLDKFLDEYYQLRGWTSNGILTSEKLDELGLSFAIKDMEAFLK